MKIIISHDVDHLHNDDHYKDLYFIKLWARSSIEFLKKEISRKEWALRMSIPFKKRMNRISELLEFDKAHEVPSTFFFGMANGLGMSYKKESAVPYIQYIREMGFDVGVHGIAFDNADDIIKEHNCFMEMTSMNNFGIRMHYVRYNEETFQKLSSAGYLYDSSEFDKEKGYIIKNPYQINSMWEFPLCLMDTYLPYNLKAAKRKTSEIIEKAESLSLEYLSILFHDIHFDKAYSVYNDWYIWVINELSSRGYEFISYKEAVRELNHRYKET